MKRETYFILLFLLTIVSCKQNDPEPDLDSKSSIIYQDSLSVDKKVWISDSTVYHVRKFYQGHYSVREDSIDTGGYSLAPYSTINFPYSIQVDGIIQLDDPSKTGYIGIVFNLTDNNHYSIFEIDNDGMYFIWTNNNGSTTTIAPYTQCSSFKTGSGVKNTLKLSQNSNKIQLRVNDVVVGKFKVAMPSDNMQAGVFVGTLNKKVPSNVEDLYYSPTTGLFNNFILTKN
ncbi:MAG TPA: hypothetical protein VL443_04235 [Cyclobacteriaceae bacterium]|jgi:hypothetical protein|nr:hypothetical protein [Cyclobacteriaceae bacterium]